MPVLRLRPSRLLLLALPIALLGPVLVALAEVLSLGATGSGADLVLTGSYRLTAWAPLILLGMALGRMPLGSPRLAAALTGIGAGAALLVTAVGLGLTALLGTLAPATFGPVEETSVVEASAGEGAEGEELASEEAASGETAGEDPAAEEESELGWDGYGEALAQTDPWRTLQEAVLSPSPHSGATVEILRSAGLALALIGGLLLVARPLRRVLLPLSAMGSMPLTSYTVHLLSLVVLVGPGGWIADNRVWAVSALVLLVACTAWSALKGRGPLERVSAWAALRTGESVGEQVRSPAAP
jgi:hypothetical protein